MKILILGSSGMLGKSFFRLSKNKHKIFTSGMQKRECDITKIKNLHRLIYLSNPDIILNFSGLTSIEYCEKNKSKATLINSKLLKNIFKIKREGKYNYWVIHISTDQMYDAKFFNKKSDENSRKSINNFYTKTKLISEKYCKPNKALVLRTNFFGKSYSNKKSLTDWFFHSIKKNKRISVFNDVYFSPIRMATLCKIILKLIENNFGERGLYNLGSKNGVSKYKFFKTFLKYLKIKYKNYESTKVRKILIIKRSKNMIMNSKKFEKKFNIILPNLENEIKNEVINNYLKKNK